jgi:hypothetical protein
MVQPESLPVVMARVSVISKDQAVKPQKNTAGFEDTTDNKVTHS